MRRLFRTLKFHILLPFVTMTLFVVVLLTFLVSNSFIRMTLKQENSKNAAGFKVAGKMVSSVIMDSRDVVNSLVVDDRVESYIRQNYTTTLS